MSMNRIIGLMLLLFILEGTIMPWLIPAGFGSRIVPHFIFVAVLFAALYSGRHRALLLGVSFGMLQDVIYFGHLMGAHAFIMGLIGYFTGLLLERKRATLMMAVSVIGMACILYDTAIFFIYKVFRITSESYAFALVDYILPSLFLQLAFALVCYVPARRLFEAQVKANPENEEQ
ncbi:rod shape-determining protein MreD [Paenibacillus arenilitoris]|uniref:Rod shape-determining protein MreD n=1 Tax=Paenibacillus arenilitoris TaxID=2772299 RepID=A0A927CN40_9BACL|nr:rod shape-determining protein MreD [Paenibacillus arenilitoris]MBD2870450.1 rod shape-determining protein MreD [Paenibacillus arenilitoris]